MSDTDMTIDIDTTAAMAAAVEAKREWDRDRSIVAMDFVSRVAFTGRTTGVLGVEITRWRTMPTCPPPQGGERVTREDGQR